MLSTNTGPLLTCILLLLKEFSHLSECSHLPSSVVKPPNVKEVRRKLKLPRSIQVSPNGVDVSLTPVPKKQDGRDHLEKLEFPDLQTFDYSADSEMMFPMSCTVTDRSYLTECFQPKEVKVTAKVVEEPLKAYWLDFDVPTPFNQKKKVDNKKANSNKFRSIGNKGLMTSPIHFQRNTSWSPNPSSSVASPVPHPPSPASIRPQIAGKKWVKKENKNLADYSGGFPGWEYSDNEESEYECVSVSEGSSEFDSDFDNPTSYSDDEDIIVVNGVRMYKPIENPKKGENAKDLYELDFNKSYSASDSDDDDDEEEDFIVVNGVKIYKPIEKPVKIADDDFWGSYHPSRTGSSDFVDVESDQENLWLEGWDTQLNEILKEMEDSA